MTLNRGGRVVLETIDAELTGRAVGLVGANGAGKSSLIGVLLGVLRPVRGRVQVLGLEVPARAREVRTRAGVMAEQAGVFPGGSGVDAVSFAGALSGLPRRESLRRAHRALDALEVGEERYRPTRGYSTGMRQRCKLAMSLVHDPEILILDEPTVGLDPPGRLQLLSLIRQLRDEGRRILISTHILADAEYLCDELLLLEGGMVAYSGPVTGLAEGDSPRWAAAGSGFTEAALDDLATRGFVVHAGSEVQVLFTPEPGAQMLVFWTWAADHGAEVRYLGPEGRSFEEAVVERMAGRST
jgi:ABC-2 type transport system ATP-binding protein